MKIKRTLLMLLCVLPLMASAMKIETDEIDEFSGNRTLITSWEGICKNDIHIRFRLQNGLLRLDFKMFYNGSIVIGKGDKLMFKSTNDNIGAFESTDIYSGTRGGGATGINGSGAWGIYATYSGDISYFSDNITRLIRVYTTDGYIDKKVSESDGIKLEKLYSLFASAQGQEPGKGASYANYIITYLKSTNGGKSWDKVEEKYVKDVSPEEIEDTINKWKSQSSGKKLFECKVKKEK